MICSFFDEDGSGYITRQEMTDQFAELGGLLTAEEIQQFHDILDSDGNGVIDVRLPSPLCIQYTMHWQIPESSGVRTFVNIDSSYTHVS